METMKRFILMLMLAVAMPVAGLAQQPAPAGSPDGRSQMRQQMMQMHQQFRSDVLGALTPAHRQLLAQTVGGLAIADNPDPKAAAATLDAALSASEKSAILAAAQKMHDQMKSMMPANPRPGWSPGPKGSPGMMDPGEILLMVSGYGDHPMMMGHGMHHR
jgi:hypothetical protein